MALKLPPEAHNQSPLFGALWAIFMIRGPSKFILRKDTTQKSATVRCGFAIEILGLAKRAINYPAMVLLIMLVIYS